MVSLSFTFFFTLLLTQQVTGFTCFRPSNRAHPSNTFLAAPSDADFAKAIPVTNDGAVDPNIYNVPIEQAAEYWTVSVSQRSSIREEGVPFLDSKSRDHFVDDVVVVVSRDGGMGMNLLEIAGGRADGVGITIVESVSGNAEKAGVLPGDSIASIKVRTSSGKGVDVKEMQQSFDCECRDFDTTIGLLTSFPPEADSLILGLKRIRRTPKINLTVEYPPIQCGEGVDNKETLTLAAGENLRQAMLIRGIVMEDRDGEKCDFCGAKCLVSVDTGMHLLNPMGQTEEKLLKYNPKCRLSCKAVVGHNMQEGNMRLRINLKEWTASDKKDTSPFGSQ